MGGFGRVCMQRRWLLDHIEMLVGMMGLVVWVVWVCYRPSCRPVGVVVAQQIVALPPRPFCYWWGIVGQVRQDPSRVV